MAITDNELLQNATLVSTLRNKPAEKVRVLADAFPETDVYDLEVIYNEINNTGIKAGSIIGFDASTPLRNKEGLKQHMASLTKISAAYHYSETELYRYENARVEAEREQLVDEAVKNIARLYEGNEDTKELIRAKLAYEGRLDYEDEKSNVKISFDYDLSEGAIVERDIYSNPLEVLEAEVQAYKDRNGNLAPEVMSMNSKTFSRLKRNDIIKQNINGDTVRAVTNSQIREFFADMDLPEIVIDDGVTVIEGVKSDKVVQHLVDDKIVFRARELGETYIGPARVDGSYVQGLYVQTIRESDPEGEKTIVGEVTMPVLKNKNAIHIINNATEVVPEG